ncbi:MAG: hypothetical protein ACO1TE_30140 [Prosthecobacter sp.]
MPAPSLKETLANIAEYPLEDLEILRSFVDMRIELVTLKAQPSTLERSDVETIQAIRSWIIEQKNGIHSGEAALLACWSLTLSGAEQFNARQINTLLTDLDCRPANITTVMDSLKNRGAVDVVGPDEPGRHKNYAITPAGVAEARRQLRLPRLLSIAG